MATKKLNSLNGLVYSTNSDVKLENDVVEAETLLPPKQLLRIRLETKQRGGKAATLIAGYIGKNEDAENLCKQLKNHCGTGGSYKNGELLIQGDNREKVKLYLIKLGYKNTK